MSLQTMNISDARRDLPRLVRQVSRSGAVAIGPRGRPAAVLVGADEYEALRSRASAKSTVSGWQRLRLDLAGTLGELDADLRAIRQEPRDEPSPEPSHVARPKRKPPASRPRPKRMP